MNFAEGDIVELISGGPCMTVTGVSVLHTTPPKQRVFLSWFNMNDDEQSSEFTNTVLKLGEFK